VITLTQTVADIADYIRSVLAEDLASRSEERAFRALIQCADNLRRHRGDSLVTLCAQEPSFTGDERFDAALAAVVEHFHTEQGLPAPTWVDQPERFLLTPWIPDPYAPADIVELSPASFVRHGVLLARSELVSL
jgi:hypothetical protein